MRFVAVLITGLVAAAVFPALASAERARHCLLRASSPYCSAWSGKVTFVADADTIYVDVKGDGTTARRHVRITGLNAMEQTVYASRASRRRGDCHAVEATARLDALLKAGRYKVRLLAQDPASVSGRRLRRSIAVRIKGRWYDVARTLIAEGHALWLPNRREYAWNRDYSVLAARAAAAGTNLWDTDYCAPGPSEGAPIQVKVNWDADGNDGKNPNGEWVRVTNSDPVNALDLGGWWLRDSTLRRYTFPAGTVVPPSGQLTVFVGRGESYDDEHFWNRRNPLFENVSEERGVGDGAYLFDPDGDLRAWSMYPCRENCADPNAGSLQLAADYRGRESIRITNTGAAPIDLEPYRLTSRPYGYSFELGSVVQPGETMVVRLWDGYEDDDALTRYWRLDRRILNNGGDVVQLRRYDDVVTACTAWGSRSC